jgi:hypothetical protein
MYEMDIVQKGKKVKSLVFSKYTLFRTERRKDIFEMNIVQKERKKVKVAGLQNGQCSEL